LVAEGVLVTSVSRGPHVRDFDVVAIELGEDLAAGGLCVLRQDVAIAVMRQAEFFQLVVNLDGGSFHADSIDRYVAREQNLQGVAVRDLAPVFTAVADDEDDLSALRIALAKIEGSADNGIV